MTMQHTHSMSRSYVHPYRRHHPTGGFDDSWYDNDHLHSATAVFGRMLEDIDGDALTRLSF
ncbi:MAG: hypothetical protein HY975_03705 [Candidatus Kerfeldbacteria bacterium]|nr:hypothetical protein [Candidatus Kerfeldbacteria bacterium]